MPAPFAVTPLNHVLRQNSWALEKLKPFAGRTARFECTPVELALTVLETGEVAAAGPEAAPDVTIGVSPGLALRVAARDESAWNEIAITGDTAFAAAIHHVWRNARWDAEEDLSHVFGDVLAHRITETARTLDRWGKQGADNLARSIAEYWTEEAPLIAGTRDVAGFNRAVDELRDDIARLEKRAERLAATGGQGQG